MAVYRIVDGPAVILEAGSSTPIQGGRDSAFRSYSSVLGKQRSRWGAHLEHSGGMVDAGVVPALMRRRDGNGMTGARTSTAASSCPHNSGVTGEGLSATLAVCRLAQSRTSALHEATNRTTRTFPMSQRGTLWTVQRYGMIRCAWRGVFLRGSVVITVGLRDRPGAVGPEKGGRDLRL